MCSQPPQNPQPSYLNTAKENWSDTKNLDKRTVNHIVLNGKYNNVLTAPSKLSTKLTKYC